MSRLRLAARLLGKLSYAERGMAFGRQPPVPGSDAGLAPAGRLRKFFEARQAGRGIWKFEHYFEVYERHFSRFVGSEVHVAEIGVYSGGSLEMWADYFGPRARVYGIDIQDACKVYANERTEIFIGDQADRSFWARFAGAVPRLDILVDDGSHRPDDQIPAFEEAFRLLAPGGVYLCEDVQGVHNGFTTYVHGLSRCLNEINWNAPTWAQQWIASISLYPLIAVVEKRAAPLGRLNAPRHGTEWQPWGPR